MAIDYEKLMNWKFPEVRHHITKRDTIIYALGIGVGSHEPFNKSQLRFLYEKNLEALPSMSSILCYPGNWLNNPATGVNYTMVMNAGTKLTIVRPLPTEAKLVSTPRVLQIIDKGPDKGAIVLSEREVFDEATGDLVCKVEAQTFCRGDGGFGGPVTEYGKPPALPTAAPTYTVDFQTAKNCHLIYRLSGDVNPLHVDPDVAKKAGFETPVVHGLCTYGIAAYAVFDRCAGLDTKRFRSIEARYTRPVFPGDVVRTEIWQDGSKVRFRASVPARQAVVLDLGQAEISA